jgi:hypothetical protein
MSNPVKYSYDCGTFIIYNKENDSDRSGVNI